MVISGGTLCLYFGDVKREKLLRTARRQGLWLQYMSGNVHKSVMGILSGCHREVINQQLLGALGRSSFMFLRDGIWSILPRDDFPIKHHRIIKPSTHNHVQVPFHQNVLQIPNPQKGTRGVLLPPSPGISRTPQRLVGIRRCAQGLLQCSQVAVPRRLLEVLGHLGVKGIHHQRQTWAGLEMGTKHHSTLIYGGFLKWGYQKKMVYKGKAH